jgi:hypothetical protein
VDHGHLPTRPCPGTPATPLAVMSRANRRKGSSRHLQIACSKSVDQGRRRHGPSMAKPRHFARRNGAGSAAGPASRAGKNIPPRHAAVWVHFYRQCPAWLKKLNRLSRLAPHGTAVYITHRTCELGLPIVRSLLRRRE